LIAELKKHKKASISGTLSHIYRLKQPLAR